MTSSRLADALALDRFALVGHDWGGAISWPAALRGDPRLAALGIVNAPHPLIFQKSLIEDADQRAASQYISAFRTPGFEQVVERMGYEGFFEKSFSRHVDLAIIPEAEKRQLSRRLVAARSDDRDAQLVSRIEAGRAAAGGKCADARLAAEALPESGGPDPGHVGDEGSRFAAAPARRARRPGRGFAGGAHPRRRPFRAVGSVRRRRRRARPLPCGLCERYCPGGAGPDRTGRAGSRRAAPPRRRSRAGSRANAL